MGYGWFMVDVLVWRVVPCANPNLQRGRLSQKSITPPDSLSFPSGKRRIDSKRKNICKTSLYTQTCRSLLRDGRSPTYIITLIISNLIRGPGAVQRVVSWLAG